MFELFELLSGVNVKFIRMLSPFFKQVGLSATELIILWKIEKRGTMRIADVAHEVGVPPSTLTSLFDRLVTQGFIERIHDEKDRRSILLKGTPKLQQTLDEVIRFADGELEKFFVGMPEGFVDRFEQDLNMLREHLSQKGIN